MEHPALGIVVQGLESLGCRVRDNGSVFVPCKLCKKWRQFSGEAVTHLRVLRLLYCEPCLTGLQLAVVKVGNAPKEIIKA